MTGAGAVGGLDDPLTERVADALWGVYRSSRKIYYPLRQKNGITPEKYLILRTVYVSGEQRIKDIASQIGTTASPVTISVQQLEGDGLVRRERSSGDERVVRVSLTARGRRVFESLREGRRRAIASLFDPLSKAEKTQLLALLSKVLESSAEGAETPVEVASGSQE